MPTRLPATDPTPPRRRPGHSTPAHRRDLRALVAEQCERRPGTYRLLAEGGRVIYVGKSRTLRARLLSYFSARGRRNKQAKILRHTFGIEWQYAPSEFAALLTELRLIKYFRPHFNSALVSDEFPRAYVAITRGPVPGLRVVRRTDDPLAEVLWGPFRRVSYLQDAVRALAEVTGVRDCALDDARIGTTPRLWFDSDGGARASGNTKRTLTTARTSGTVASARNTRTPGCLRVQIGTCAGPCVGTGDAHAYATGVAAARAFLSGASNAPVSLAEQRMREAADALHFERAGVWRDKTERLSWLHDRLRRFHASMDRLTFRYTVHDPYGPSRVYLVRRGTVRADCEAPDTPAATAELEALANRVFCGPDPKGADIPTHDLDEFFLVASWFRRHPDELQHTSPAM